MVSSGVAPSGSGFEQLVFVARWFRVGWLRVEWFRASSTCCKVVSSGVIFGSLACDLWEFGWDSKEWGGIPA